MVALGTTAPVVSVIFPNRVAVLSCANALPVKMIEPSSRNKIFHLQCCGPVVIIQPPIESIVCLAAFWSLCGLILGTMKDSSLNEQLSMWFIGNEGKKFDA